MLSSEEIREKGLSPEFIKQLRNPNVRFDNNIVVFPAFEFANEAEALILARSADILNVISRESPMLKELLNHNRRGTLLYLNARHAMTAHRQVIKKNWKSHTDSGEGPKVWRDYRDKIEEYVEDLCKEWKDKDKETGQWNNFTERLGDAKRKLANHIHEKFPRWPSMWNKEQEGNIELNIGGLEENLYSIYKAVWSCVGEVWVKDERVDFNTFKAEFRGNPEVKLLVFNFDKIKKLEKEANYLMNSTGEGIEYIKKQIDNFEIENRYSERLTWRNFFSIES